MITSNRNIKFGYLYRDASNFKNFGEIIFVNDTRLSLSEITEIIKSHLIDELWFSASKWNIPDLYFTEWIDEIDHNWHEFECVEETNENATEKRVISEFVFNIELVSIKLYRTSE